MSIQIHINHLKQNVREGLTATINKWSIKSYLNNNEADTGSFHLSIIMQLFYIKKQFSHQ